MLTWLAVGAAMGLTSGALVIGFRASGGERPSLVLFGSALAGITLVLVALGVLALIGAWGEAWSGQLE